MNKKVAIPILIVAGLLGLVFLFYASMGNLKNRVEVCVAFQGRTSCRTASADTQDHALHTAQTNACALIASGVTDTMQCERSAPTSVKWLETK